MRIDKIKNDLRQHRNQQKADELLRFFKTGPGEYGEGDVFFCFSVPDQRKIARGYKKLSIKTVERLLSSKIHEHRLTALLILVEKYAKAEEFGKKEIYKKQKNIGVIGINYKGSKRIFAFGLQIRKSRSSGS